MKAERNLRLQMKCEVIKTICKAWSMEIFSNIAVLRSKFLNLNASDSLNYLGGLPSFNWLPKL